MTRNNRAKNFVDRVMTGKVRFFKKDYGFITPDDPDVDDVFVHFTAIEPWREGFKELEEGQRVKFKCIEGREGKLRAAEVERSRDDVVKSDPKEFEYHGHKQRLDGFFKG